MCLAVCKDLQLTLDPQTLTGKGYTVFISVRDKSFSAGDT